MAANSPAATPADPAATPADPADPAANSPDPAANPAANSPDPAAAPADPSAAPADPAATPADPAATPADPSADPADPSADPSGVQQVPKYRLDAVRQREIQKDQTIQELKDQIAELSKQTPAPTAPVTVDPEVDIAALSAEHTQALIDGDAAKATVLQQKMILAASKPSETIDTEKLVGDAVAQATTNAAVQAMANQLEQVYPALNKDDPAFDQGTSDEVIDIYNGLVQTGHNPADALARAADLVMRQVPNPGAPPTADRGLPAKLGAAAAPPSMTKAGESGVTPSLDLENMSQEEYEALPQATRDKILSGQLA